VAFNGRERKHADHVTSVLTFNPPAPIDSGAVTPTGGGNGSTTVTAPDTGRPAPNVQLPDSGTTDRSGAQSPPDVADQPPVVAQQQQQPVALSRAFQYPLAFLMPLALLAGAVFFTRLFTRDATPRFSSR
jgi:hypothetical protein